MPHNSSNDASGERVSDLFLSKQSRLNTRDVIVKGLVLYPGLYQTLPRQLLSNKIHLFVFTQGSYTDIYYTRIVQSTYLSCTLKDVH